MIARLADPAALTLDILLIALSLALLLAFFRLAVGPSLPDRVVALDLIAMLIVGIIGIFAIRTSETTMLRVGLVVALVNFLGTVAFARFLERKQQDD